MADLARLTRRLRGIFHPRWTPFLDLTLLGLRDDGVSLDRIAQALLRPPREVERRWHQLRVVPGVRQNLKEFAALKLVYPSLEDAHGA